MDGKGLIEFKVSGPYLNFENSFPQILVEGFAFMRVFCGFINDAF